MKELSFPLERSPSMQLLGKIWTGSISGQVLVGALLLIGVYFMGMEEFNIISIAFFIGFILPVSYILHKRLVRKGKKLMHPWCDIQYEKNNISFKTGFPNTMNPEWQTVKITKENKNITIKGGELSGYHLKLGGTPPVRLGLWMNLSDAKESAKELASLLGGDVTEDILQNS
ncbi:MAG: hypothetical protein ACXAD7_17230 [Candidatus Kariarchaeaceae archaeon]|jgi:hypothetical protein